MSTPLPLPFLGMVSYHVSRHDEYSWLKWRNQFHLQCKRCRWNHFDWAGVTYLRHPRNGWWEPEHHNRCNCRFYDEKGIQLCEQSPFFTKYKIPYRLLRIDYVEHINFVKYYDPNDREFSDDVGPLLGVRDIIAAASLRPLLSTIRIFQHDARPRLLCLREASSLASALQLVMLHRFHCCSRAIWYAIAPRRSDTAWVRACQLGWLTVTANFTEQQTNGVIHSVAYIPCPIPRVRRAAKERGKRVENPW